MNLRNGHLGLQVIPAEAEFLAWGSDSVTAFRALSQIRAVLNVEVAIPELFNQATIPGLASIIDQRLATRRR